MANILSPSYARIRYTANGHRHVMTFQVKLVSGFVPGTEPSLERRDGDPILFATAMDALISFLVPFYTTSSTFSIAEVWSKPTIEDDPVFIFAYDADTAGEVTGTPVTAGQYTFPFRTTHRGGMKLVLLESVQAAFVRNEPPFPALSPENALANYILGDSNVVQARNNDWPLVALGSVSKINDVLARKYLTAD